MAVPQDRKCPSCHYFALMPHCPAGEDATCDLVRCDRCKSYGLEGGPLWVDRAEVA